jgi:hypothetical protein
MPLDQDDRQWLEERFDAIHQRVDTAFHGPEGEPHKGIWVRLDRAERIIAVALWIATAAVTAGIGALAKAFTTGSTPPSNPHP